MTPGSQSVYCADCGEKKPGSGTVIPATGHVWNSGTVTVPATVQSAGVRTFTCVTCGITRTEAISRLPAASSAPSGSSDQGSEKGTGNSPVIRTGDGYYWSGNGFYKIKPDGTAEFVKMISGSKKKSLTINNTVKLNGKTYRIISIAKNACKGNAYLSGVIIGKNISQIGKNAFYGCRKLKKVTIRTTGLKAKSVGKNAFKGIYAKASFKVPKSRLAAYRKFLKNAGVGKNVKIKK